MSNPKSATERKVYETCVYDKDGIICHIPTLHDHRGRISIFSESPIRWNTVSEPDFTSGKCHFVKHQDRFSDENKYWFMVPIESAGEVTIKPERHDVFATEMQETVTTPFGMSMWVSSPNGFDQYLMYKLIKELDDNKHKLGADDIAEHRDATDGIIGDFLQAYEDYRDEVERLVSMPDEEFFKLCGYGKRITLKDLNY